MLPLDDEKWKEFEGGYRIKYDASRPLLALEQGTQTLDSIWSDLSEHLHHQGDVGIASYAAVPHIARIVRQRGLFDWHPFALVVTIELARTQRNNPPLPTWLTAEYEQSLWDMAEYACKKLKEEWNPSLLKSVLSLIAIIKGGRDLGELIIEVDAGYERLALDKYFEG